MKQKLRLLKTGLVCCALALLSCQDDLPDQIGHDTHGHSKHTYLDFETFSQQFPETASKVKQQNDKTNEHLQRGVYDPENDFTIETDKIFMGENEGGSYITFKVSKDNDSDGLDNLVLKINSENEVTPMLLHYDLTEQEKAGLLNNDPIENIGSKMSFEILDGTILNTSNTTNKMECTTFVVAECVGALNHPKGIDENGNRCPGYSESTVTTCSGSDSGGGSGPPNMPSPTPPSTPNTGNNPGQHGGGGGNPGTGTYNPNLPVITTPIFEAGQAISPCTKISNLFSSMPTLKAGLESLALKTSESNEWGNYKVTSSSIIQTAPSTTATGVSFPTAIDGKYVMIAHTHNSPASSTYSVFSWADLIGMAQLIRKGKIDTDQFVAFLMTADGTRYALTIDDPYAFLNIFARPGEVGFDMQKSLKITEQAGLYYLGETPQIKEENTDNLRDEKTFLDLLHDNNMGVSLFEVDATFTAFEKVTHNKTTDNVDKQPCN